MPLGPDELDDESWELVRSYLAARMEVLKQTDNAFAIQLLKMEWGIVTEADPARKKDYVNRLELEKSKSIKTVEDTKRPALLARIAELEEATKTPG